MKVVASVFLVSSVQAAIDEAVLLQSKTTKAHVVGSKTSPTMCEDDLSWEDQDGPVCPQLQGNPTWCTDYGEWSSNAASACPVSCGLCAGQFGEKGCVDCVNGGEGWSNGQCYPKCQFAPQDDAGCWSKAMHGANGLSTLGHGSTELICATANLGLLQSKTQLKTSPTMCEDDLSWEDQDGPVCPQLQGNPTWCTDYGEWSSNAASACPVSCGLCAGQFGEKGCVDCVNGGEGWSNGQCYPKCQFAPQDDAGCWSKAMHGANGLSTLGHGSTELICATANLGLLQLKTQSKTSPTMCEDDLSWEDQDGPVCPQLQGNPTWCTDYGEWSSNAASACPVSCGLCAGQFGEKGCVDCVNGGEGWSNGHCYPKCQFAPQDDAGCWSKAMHGANGLSTLGHGSTELICATANLA